MPAYFRQLIDPSSTAMTYLLADPVSRRALLIDPHPAHETLIDALLAERGFELCHVLHTHSHLLPVDRLLPARPLTTETWVHFGAESLRAIATPGHTTHCASFLWRDRLFCGDALEICGAPGAPTSPREPCSDPGLLFDSLRRRILTLPDETLLFPGHAHDGRTVSTVAEERRRNPCLATGARDAFVAAHAAARPPEHRHATAQAISMDSLTHPRKESS